MYHENANRMDLQDRQYARNNPLDRAKMVARQPIAFPGGYSVLLLLADGETLCPKCIRSEWRNIVDDIKAGYNSGWTPEASYIHWEGPSEYCAHCNTELPSEYGDPDSEEIENG